MTNILGPITITNPAYIDERGIGSSKEVKVSDYNGTSIISTGYNEDGVEKFQVSLTGRQLFQVMELMKQGEMIWIDLAPDLTYYHIVPKGLYILGEVTEDEWITADHRLVSITAKQITNNSTDTLKYAYSTGQEDGTIINTEYDTTTTVTTKWDEDFSSWDTTNDWYASTSHILSTTSISVAGGKAVFTGTASTSSKWGMILAPSKHTYKTPIYYEFDLEVGAAPSTYGNGQTIHLVDKRINSTGNPFDTSYSFIRIGLWTYPTTNYLKVEKYIKGKWYALYSEDVTNAVTIVNLRVLIDSTNKLSIWYDDEGTGFDDADIIIDEHKTGINFIYIWITPGFYNAQNTSKSGYMGNFKAYTVTRGGTATFPNIISLPIKDGGYYSITPDATRASADGNIPIYDAPVDNLTYVTDMTDSMDLGAVKTYNYNTTTSTYEPVFGSREIFTPSSFKATNGLIQLKLTATGVEFYYWNGTAYALLNTFVIGTITTIKVKNINRERTLYQFNDTYWLLQRGKKHILVYHDFTDIGYTAKDFYYHDDGTGTMAEEDLTSAGADADVDMDDWYYCNIYDTTGEDAYNLQIVKTYPQTIKNDSIPADENTIIGWYKKGDTGYDTSAALALESHVWPQCNIMFES